MKSLEELRNFSSLLLKRDRSASSDIILPWKISGQFTFTLLRNQVSHGICEESPGLSTNAHSAMISGWLIMQYTKLNQSECNCILNQSEPKRKRNK